MVNKDTYIQIRTQLAGKASLVAVSKTKAAADILELYELGQREFAENYVQELVDKQLQLPADIRWHFIGHLQTNKVKYISPFISLVHSVDSYKLLQEINKQAQKNNRMIECLLQVHIAVEETKFGLDEAELKDLFQHENLASFKNINIKGLMGMASFSEDEMKIKNEFRHLKSLFDTYASQEIPQCRLTILSMGMSADYKIALDEGSNLVRIGSLLFGNRE